MKKDILSIITVICAVILLYILFIQKNSSDTSYVVSSVLAFIIIVLTFLNVGKNTVKKKWIKIIFLFTS